MSYSKEKSFIKRAQAFNENVPVNYYFQDDVTAWKFPKLIPGHVFTFDYLARMDEAAVPSVFDYTNQNKLKAYEYKKPYYDTKPIGLSLGRLSEGPEEYILNVKAMPKAEALVVFEIFFRAANQVLERYAVNEIKKEDGSFERILRPIDERMRNFDYVKQFVTMNPTYFQNTLGRGIYFWVNKYNMNMARNVQLVDFDVLEKLVHSDYTHDKNIAFNGNTLQDVHDLYNYVKNK